MLCKNCKGTGRVPSKLHRITTRGKLDKYRHTTSVPPTLRIERDDCPKCLGNGWTNAKIRRAVRWGEELAKEMEERNRGESHE